MLDNRARRKRNSKMKKLTKKLGSSHAIVEHYTVEMEAMEVGNNKSYPSIQQPQDKWCQPLLHQQPICNAKQQKNENPLHELVSSVIEKDLGQLVIVGGIDTAIADSGASSSCAKEPVSECRRYILAADPLVETGKTLDRVFQYGFAI